MCKEGSPESEIHPEVSPEPKEKMILKHRYSAFYNTDLETVLRCLKVEDIVITETRRNAPCFSHGDVRRWCEAPETLDDLV